MPTSFGEPGAAVCILVFAASTGRTVAHLLRDKPIQEHAGTTRALITCSHCTLSVLQGSGEALLAPGESHMMVPAVPPHTMELAESPRSARKPSPEGAAEGGLPGTTRRSPCASQKGLTTAYCSLIHQHPLQTLTA